MPDALRNVGSEEILDAIRANLPINYEHVRIQGNLDISELDLPTDHAELTCPKVYGLLETKKIVTSSIKIKDSVIEGVVNFDNVIFQETFMPDWAPMRMKMGSKYIFRINHSINYETSNKG
jgi:hypothetical protein